MSKLAIDYDKEVPAIMGPRTSEYVNYVRLWDPPPADISYESAINLMHERTLELAKMLETIINVLPELPVVSLPRGQRPDSDGFKP